MSEEAFPFDVGDIIKERYKLIRNISQGKRGAVYCALDQKMRQFAVKLEQNSGLTQVCIEAAVLNILAGQNHIPQFFHYGQHQGYKFLACELLGPNMIDLVNYNKHLKYSLHSVLKFGIQAIEAIKIVHKQKFVHRDIKPGNFLIGNAQGTTGTFYIADFGLCKKLNIVDGTISMPTNKAKFRGSMAYASLNAHNYVELGRQDDLISLLYILVEFFNGILPWSGIEDAGKVKKMKKHYSGLKLLKRLPKQFLQFDEHIQQLEYTISPDYLHLISLLEEAAEENKVDLNAPFEWEEEMNDERDKITKHHIAYAQKVHDKIEEMEKEKLLIQVNNEKDALEQIEQIDKEINESKQSVLTPQQFKIKLNTLNIIHRLRRKHENYYQQEQLKQLQKTGSRYDTSLMDIQSCIQPVKSYNQYNEFPDLVHTKTNSHSPFHSPQHSPIPKKQSRSDTRENLLSNVHHNNSPFYEQYSNDDRRGTNTIQDLVDILDAIIGASADVSQSTNNTNQQIVSTRQQDKNSFIDQFINEMQQKGKKPNDIDWDQFINNVGGSSEYEQFEQFSSSQHNEMFNGILSPTIDLQESLMKQSIKSQHTQNSHDLGLPGSIYFSPLLEHKHSNSPCYSPLLLSPQSSSYGFSPQHSINNQVFEFMQHPATDVDIDIDFDLPLHTNQQSFGNANTMPYTCESDFHVQIRIEGKEVISPFQIRQEVDMTNLNYHNLFTQQRNQLQNQITANSSTQYSEQHTHSQIFTDQARNAVCTEAKVEQSLHNTNPSNSYAKIIPLIPQDKLVRGKLMKMPIKTLASSLNFEIAKRAAGP
ncbi:MAG: putative protein serine/threonine kinase [Streblomastix strix]|uniref:non-specific serine/threonine protein kinase n=1 Tax=Streblomastix strix TaxID=222440 RepID=A0A5J4X5D8_9EUKA|nr:MAG: putative protein serine/threonine kinase [Streblomastix strix]